MFVVSKFKSEHVTVPYDFRYHPEDPQSIEFVDVCSLYRKGIKIDAASGI